MRRITAAFFAMGMIGFASAAIAADVRYQRIALDDGKLCVDSRLSTKQMKMAGIFGSDLGSSVRGVFVDYPLARKAELTLFVRLAGNYERPLPVVEEDQLHPLQDVAGLSATPMDSHKAQRFVASEEDSALIGRFVAVCRDLPIPRQCSRPFRYSGLVGTYSFKREQLRDWKILENALSQALSSRAIAKCSDHKRPGHPKDQPKRPGPKRPGHPQFSHSPAPRRGGFLQTGPDGCGTLCT